MKIRIETKNDDKIDGELVPIVEPNDLIHIDNLEDWVAIRVELEEGYVPEPMPPELGERPAKLGTAVMYIRRDDVRAYVVYE